MAKPPPRQEAHLLALTTAAQRTWEHQELVGLYQVQSTAFGWPCRLLRRSWFTDMMVLVLMYQPHAECFSPASMPQTKLFHSLTVSILTVFCRSWMVIKCCTFLSPDWIQLKGNLKYLAMLSLLTFTFTTIFKEESKKEQRIHFFAVCKIGFSGIL